MDGRCEASTVCIDEDGDGYGEGCEAGPDCDDTRADINPGRPEICNGIDDNCNFFIDEGNVCAPCVAECDLGESFCSGDAITRCDDAAGCPQFARPEPCDPGLGCRDGACVEVCIDEDGDGFFVDCGRLRDCDDTRSDVYPGAPERCDGVDNNCNGLIDEGGVCALECEDLCVAGPPVCTATGRGFVRCEEAPNGCLALSAITPCGDGRTCADGVCQAREICIDPDGDGFGPGCPAGEDCRNVDASIFPGATERCNGLDDNCNGLVDEGGVCTPCPEALLSSPATTDGGRIYRVACGGAEYIRLAGATGRTLGVVQGEAALTADVGVIRDGAFQSLRAATAGGTARTFIADAPAGETLVVRVNAPAGTSYALAHNAAQAGCRAEASEPNNSPLAPALLGAGAFAEPAWICAGDFDFYGVRTRPGEVVDATIVFDPDTSGTIIVSVWRNGVEVTPSFGAEDGPSSSPWQRHAHFRTDLPGDYVVGVRGIGPGVEKPYAIALRVHAAPACTDDRFEEQEGLFNDSVATARPISAAGNLDGVLCPGDYDIYALGDLRAGGSIAGGFSASNPNVRVRVLFGGWGGPRDFPTGVSANGRYYLVVYGLDARATGTYSLNWSIPR